MSKLITTYRVKAAAAEKLKDKAIAITIEKKELINEAKILDWLLENFLDDVDPKSWPRKPEKAIK